MQICKSVAKLDSAPLDTSRASVLTSPSPNSCGLLSLFYFSICNLPASLIWIVIFIISINTMHSLKLN